MWCNNCGKELREGSEFCPNCGARINSENGAFNQMPEYTSMHTPSYENTYIPDSSPYATPAAYPTPGATAYSTTTAKNNNKTVIMAVLAVAMAVIAFFLIKINFIDGPASKLLGTWKGEMYGTEITYTFTEEKAIVEAMGQREEYPCQMKDGKIYVDGENAEDDITWINDNQFVLGDTITFNRVGTYEEESNLAMNIALMIGLIVCALAFVYVYKSGGNNTGSTGGVNVAGIPPYATPVTPGYEAPVTPAYAPTVAPGSQTTAPVQGSISIDDSVPVSSFSSNDNSMN